MIVGVAIKKDQIVYFLPEPYRHHHVIKMMKRDYADGKPHKYQGFVTDDWKYLTRKEAAIYALENGQCSKLGYPPRLFSEDLW